MEGIIEKEENMLSNQNDREFKIKIDEFNFK
jgi:hypothetical protein